MMIQQQVSNMVVPGSVVVSSVGNITPASAMFFESSTVTYPKTTLLASHESPPPPPASTGANTGSASTSSAQSESCYMGEAAKKEPGAYSILSGGVKRKQIDNESDVDSDEESSEDEAADYDKVQLQFSSICTFILLK